MRSPLHPALVKLLRLRLRGGLRRVFRNVKTVRGAVFFGIGLLLIGVWIVPQFVMLFTSERSDPEGFRTVAPLALLGMCVLSLLTAGKQRGVVFSPAELDFLFCGPFSRRQLLAYKLASGAGGAIFSALVFSVFFFRFARFWITIFVGLLLAIWFMQLFGTCVVLIGQTVAEKAYTRLRQWTLLGVIGLVALGLGLASAGGLNQGIWPLLDGFRSSIPGRVVLAPFEVFIRTMTAERLARDFVGWGAIALGIDLVLLATVMRLDANYLEASVATSQKIYQRVQRARRGGMAWSGSSKARWRLPQFPWLGGAGPIARRQLTAAARNVRAMLFYAMVLAVVMAPALVSTGKSQGIQFGTFLGPFTMLTVLLTQSFSYDFRGDLDHLDWLKSLPVRSVAIAAGELFTPVLVMTVIHVVLLAAVSPFFQGQAVGLLVVACFTLPFNLLLFGLENLIFLLFPSRVLTTAAPGDLQRVGRVMVEMMLKLAVLAGCCGMAALAAVPVYFLFGESWFAGLAVAWLVLAFFGASSVPCVAAAFRQFDVSVDTPA